MSNKSTGLAEQVKLLTLENAELTTRVRKLSHVNVNLSAELRAKEEAYRLLESRTQHERLTGLMSRDFFEDSVSESLVSSKHRRSSDAIQTVDVLVMIDVDRFKPINDTYGHPVGDKILATLGKVIHSFIRPTDFACRFGGDEFVVFFRGIKSIETATQKIIDCRKEFEKSISDFGLVENSLPLETSFSFGMSTVDGELHTFATLYQEADNALYQQKKERKNLTK